MHSTLSHPGFLKGSGLASDLTDFPVLGQIFTLIPCCFSNLLHSYFIVSIKGPETETETGTRIRGAEIWQSNCISPPPKKIQNFDKFLDQILNQKATNGIIASQHSCTLTKCQKPVRFFQIPCHESKSGKWSVTSAPHWSLISWHDAESFINTHK